jgi:hypothetical protein
MCIEYDPVSVETLIERWKPSFLTYAKQLLSKWNSSSLFSGFLSASLPGAGTDVGMMASKGKLIQQNPNICTTKINQ